MATRSKRLRKKLHVDEFAVLGFEVSFDFALIGDAQAVDQFLDNIIDLVETSGLLIGGGINTSSSFFVMKERRYESTSQQDMDTLAHWLKQRAHVSNVVCGGLVDAYYS
jgi:uncharacterized protein YggL (DUF469 family)